MILSDLTLQQSQEEIIQMNYPILEYDSYMKPYASEIELRMNNYNRKKEELLGGQMSLLDFANGYAYFGFHKTENGWYYREWAPGADEVYLMGDMNGWNPSELKLQPVGNGTFELFLSGKYELFDGCYVKTLIHKDGQQFERVPLYAKRVVQDPNYYTWTAQITDTTPFDWTDQGFHPSKELYIYECHIGMAQEEAKIGSYREFTQNILPRIKRLGYNTIQIMAIMEHPFYGSFGYQVSSFFAASSRFGKPNELMELINAAHSMGITVLLDLIHSHAVKNTAEGINQFDGTDYQFFHTGVRGEHPAWDTKLFNYDKNEVIHFLLSNLKFWMTEYHFDGFRFDGVTSMIYHNHGLGEAFTDYSKYFSLNTDTEAITYLQLANELIREVNPNAITIAEDMSAMPGMCLPIADGGIGFDYRLSMGVPDMWIKLLRKTHDEDWSMYYIWHELTSRRPKEKYIGYAESHDQALVGDKTIMFWLCDSAMYTDMSKNINSMVIDRGIALHKMIRLVTLTLAGEGYLNFMGNEFGHPEWVDFPREGNHDSYHYCRRQWSLADNGLLKYEWLQEFDQAMISLSKEHGIFSYEPVSLYIDESAHVLVYTRSDLMFILNFHPSNSYESYFVHTGEAGDFIPLLSTDESRFGGWNRIAMDITYPAKRAETGDCGLQIYLPARTGVCLQKK